MCESPILVCLFQIWDVLSNEEVVDIVSSCSERENASRTLVQTAVKAWKSKYPTSKVDDCAVVCLFLDSDESSFSTIKSKENASDDEEISDTENTNGEVDKDWSALEGVARVNTMVTLPRFVPGEEDKPVARGLRSRK